MLSKSVPVSGINCLLDRSNPDGNVSQSSAIDLRKRCSQLEGHSGTWVGSSLRQTFSFLSGMTRKAKTREKEKMKEAKDARYTNG
ncbi:ARHGEF2 isoform 18, partial [Pan troglodytes]